LGKTDGNRAEAFGVLGEGRKSQGAFMFLDVSKVGKFSPWKIFPV